MLSYQPPQRNRAGIGRTWAGVALSCWPLILGLFALYQRYRHSPMVLGVLFIGAPFALIIALVAIAVIPRGKRKRLLPFCILCWLIGTIAIVVAAWAVEVD